MQWNDDELLEVFLAESRENLMAMEDGLLQLEKHPADSEALDSVFRAAHTLKGGAATLGFQTIADTAHGAEDLLDAIRTKQTSASPANSELLLETVDLLRSLLPEKMGECRDLDEAQQTIRERLRNRGSEISNATEPEQTLDVDGSRPVPRGRALRVSVDRLDRMLDLSGEVNIARSLIGPWVREQRDQSLTDAVERLDQMLAELQDLIKGARMVPLDGLLRQYVRTVRDSARVSGKNAQLVVEGGEVELDTRIVELVKDPLTQIIRNAVAHGIETSSERARLGKPEIGTIRVRARRESPALVIEISDDGRGFDRERIVARARQLGLSTPGARLTDQQAFALVFAPGFSTQDGVTGLAGRGFGMDIVQKNVSALRGSIAITSTRGAGSTIAIRLPLTLAVIAALPIESGNELFALPLDSIAECVDLPAGTARQSEVIDVRGEAVPAISLAEAFGLPSQPSARNCLVVVNHSGGKAGLIVDRLFESAQAIVKPLGKLFAGLPFIAGSTVLTNGRVALILDVDGVVGEMTRRRTTSAV
jgi:two-component system chemotaxis sensor kinase CheA